MDKLVPVTPTDDAQPAWTRVVNAYDPDGDGDHLHYVVDISDHSDYTGVVENAIAIVETFEKMSGAVDQRPLDPTHPLLMELDVSLDVIIREATRLRSQWTKGVASEAA